MLNVKQNTYCQYEIGIVNYPLDVVVKLAEYYNVSVDYLVKDRLEEPDGLGRNYYCQAYAQFFAYALPRLKKARGMLNMR